MRALLLYSQPEVAYYNKSNHLWPTTLTGLRLIIANSKGEKNHWNFDSIMAEENNWQTTHNSCRELKRWEWKYVRRTDQYLLLDLVQQRYWCLLSSTDLELLAYGFCLLLCIIPVVRLVTLVLDVQACVQEQYYIFPC